MLKKYNDKYILYTQNGTKGSLVIDAENRWHSYVRHDREIPGAIAGLGREKKIFKNVAEIERYAETREGIKTAYYNLTYYCNLKCKYCYAAASEKSHVGAGENEKILAALKKIGVKSLVLIGGEPFCHPRLLEILQAAVKNGFEGVSIVTNGTLLPERTLEFIVKNRIEVQVSLDGLTEKINSLTRGERSFEKVYSNIARLQAARVPLKVMQTITRDNIRHAFGFFKHFKDLGIPAGFFIVKENAANAVRKPQLRQIKSLMDKLFAEEKSIFRVFDIVKITDNMAFGRNGFPVVHCGAGINSITISPKGDVFPCVKLCDEGLAMGNLLSAAGVKAFLGRKKPCASLPFVDGIGGCAECRIKYFCGGGCRAEHFRAKKGFCRASCVYYIELLEYFLSKVMNYHAALN